MNEKNGDLSNTWTDPDAAPELDDTFFNEAYHYANNRLIKRGCGRPPLSEHISNNQIPLGPRRNTRY